MNTMYLNSLRNWLSIGAIVAAYVYQMYRAGIGATFSVSEVVVIVLISLLIGLLTFFGITLVGQGWQRIKSRNSPDQSLASSIEHIEPDELCALCDQATTKLHRIITDSLQLPDFDSDLVEDMNQGIAASWLTPCTAFSYGVVTIGMLKRDANFLQSSINNNLRNYVLNKMAKKMNETSLICKSEENSNRELVDEVTEDLKVVERGVIFYFKSVQSSKTHPFIELIDFLTIKVHRDLKQKIPDIEAVAENMLQRVDAYIDNGGELEYVK